MKFWNVLASGKEPFIFRGKYEAYDETGKQYWTEDPNDPNIAYYPFTTIDGYRDGVTGEYFSGEFSSVDKYGNFYGYRSRAFNVAEDGSGDLVNGATIYNFSTEEWTDNPDYTNFVIGTGDDKYVFPMGDRVIVDGVEKTLTETFGFSVTRTLSSVRSISDDGKVIGANLSELHPGTGEMLYYPAVIVLDEPLVAGIDDVVSENGITIIVSAGRVDVAGTDDVTIYDLKGSVVSNAVTSYVAPGMYIVKAGDTTRKVFVK